MNKIVFFDIDGTIWDENMKIPDSTKQAIQKLREKGNKAFLCTGRSRVNICMRKMFPIEFDGIIAACGNHIELNNKVVFENVITGENIKKVIDVCKKNHMPIIIEGPDKLWMDRTGFEHDLYVEYLKEELKENLLYIDGYSDDIQMNKFSANISEDTDFEDVKAQLEDCFDFLVHGGDVVECVPKGVSKATGIQWLCNYLGISHEDTYAIGDSVNDLDMLSYVAHGIAMGNGSDVAKEAADYITTELENDGIYHALQHFELI